MDCFFIGDVNSTDDSVDDARDFIKSLTGKTSYGAVYYPWLRMADPTGRSPKPMLAPPSGFVAGLYARIDSRRGVFKAPGGNRSEPRRRDRACRRHHRRAAGLPQPDRRQRHPLVPGRRAGGLGGPHAGHAIRSRVPLHPGPALAIFLEQSIYNGIQFAVFEPNDEPLWASLRLNISAFMFLQFRAGAFQGKSAGDAFFVKCDASTTTQQDIDAGSVNILVGFAPLKPAEFVVLQLTQKAGQPAG